MGEMLFNLEYLDYYTSELNFTAAVLIVKIQIGIAIM